VALPICLEIPEIPDPLTITLPGGVSIQQINLMEAIQSGKTSRRSSRTSTRGSCKAPSGRPKAKATRS